MSLGNDVRTGKAADAAGTSAENAGGGVPKAPEPEKKAAPEGAEQADAADGAAEGEKFRPDLDEAAVRKSYQEAQKKITELGQRRAELERENARLQAMQNGAAIRSGTTGPAKQAAESGQDNGAQTDVDWAALVLENPAEFNKLLGPRITGGAQVKPSAAPTHAPDIGRTPEAHGLELMRLRHLVSNPEFKKLEPEVMEVLNGNPRLWLAEDPFALGFSIAKGMSASAESAAAQAEAERRGAQEEVVRREAEARATTLGGGAGGRVTGKEPDLAQRIVSARGGTGGLGRDVRSRR